MSEESSRTYLTHIIDNRYLGSILLSTGERMPDYIISSQTRTGKKLKDQYHEIVLIGAAGTEFLIRG